MNVLERKKLKFLSFSFPVSVKIFRHFHLIIIYLYYCFDIFFVTYTIIILQVDHEDRLEEARHVYEDANKKLRQNGEKEERLMLLEAWKQFEKELYQV